MREPQHHLNITMQDNVIVVSGDLDMTGGPVLHSAILAVESDAQPLILDLEHVQFVDSSGLRTMLAAVHRAGASVNRVTLRHVGPELIRLLDITGTRAMFDIEAETAAPDVG